MTACTGNVLSADDIARLLDDARNNLMGLPADADAKTPIERELDLWFGMRRVLARRLAAAFADANATGTWMCMAPVRPLLATHLDTPAEHADRTLERVLTGFRNPAAPPDAAPEFHVEFRDHAETGRITAFGSGDGFPTPAELARRGLPRAGAVRRMRTFHGLRTMA